MLICPRCGGDMYTYSYSPGNQENAKKYNIWSAYVKMFKSASDFRTRSRRSEFWYAYLMNFIISFIMIMILMLSLFPELGNMLDLKIHTKVAYVTEFVYMVYSIVIFLPQLALTVRRLHDIGMNGIWAALTLFPAGSLVILFFMTRDSMPGVNMYGPNPKGIN